MVQDHACELVGVVHKPDARLHYYVTVIAYYYVLV